MLPAILVAATAVYAVSKLSNGSRSPSSCQSSEQDVAYYRNHAVQANSQLQAKENELEWRRVKENQARVKRHIAMLKQKRSHARRGSAKYANLGYQISQSVKAKEQLQAMANELKPQRGQNRMRQIAHSPF